MRSRYRRVLIATAVVVAVALCAVGAFALTGGFDKTTTAEAHGGGSRVVRVKLVDATIGFDITPDVVAIDLGTHLILDVVNAADGRHDLAVDGGRSRTRLLNPGESERLDLGRVTADIRMLCTLPAHDFAGMSLDVRIDDA